MPIKCPIKRKEKQREYSKKHYEKNKERMIAQIATNKKKMREQWELFKSRLRCVKCGENHPATLDFHHVVKDPLNKKIYKLTCNGAYRQAMEEIQAKCIVLCSNCHRVLHYEERNNPAEAGLPAGNPPTQTTL